MAARQKAARGAARRQRALVVDDAQGIRTYLANLLELKGYDVDTAEDGRRALALLEGGAAPDVILLDVMMPGLGGVETLRRIRELDENLPVVMLSVVGKASTIVEAMQVGASDYLNKPFEDGELELALEKVLTRRELEREREALAQELIPCGDNAVWASGAMQRVHGLLEQVADTDVTMLIQGESGVGKEIVARTAHELSPRRKRPFIKVNCAALPTELLESELFGYEKGAFTGAAARKHGRFEMAQGGTIFLDEIAEMSTALQAKLLQVLQDGEFTRLGGNREVRVDVRVLCATNRNLVEMVQANLFREDLFFRLNVVNVPIPPLRDRREEIGPLIENFLRRFSARYERPAPQLSESLLEEFNRYGFPGNVRELENMIKRVVVLGSEEPILTEMIRSERASRHSNDVLRALLEEVEHTAGEVPLREVGRRAALQAEREAIDRVLHYTNWNRKRAAELLGVSYKTLLQKIRGCGLEPG
ncbi:MAG TPA: sigma-54 dependent transcriptional regulator [Myxococcota bacterium]